MTALMSLHSLVGKSEQKITLILIHSYFSALKITIHLLFLLLRYGVVYT